MTIMFLTNKNKISLKFKSKQFCAIFYSKERLVIQIPLLILDLKLLNHSLHKIYIFINVHNIFLRYINVIYVASGRYSYIYNSAVVNCLPKQFNIKVTYNRCYKIQKHAPYPIMYWTQIFEKLFCNKYIEILYKD